MAEGELVSIVGPSGCGKSTLLRCIAGLLRPRPGQVALSGAAVDEVPDGLAVVFQDYSRSLLPVADASGQRGAAAAPDASAAEGPPRPRPRAALAAVGLPGVGQYPWQLSGGMQQRVAIARALACDPALLLMDEPFGSVDAQTREDLEDLTLRVRGERDITILLVTHDIDESVYVGDRVIVLTPRPRPRPAPTCPWTCPRPATRSPPSERPEFVQLRTEVSRLIRSRPDGREPSGIAQSRSGRGDDR